MLVPQHLDLNVTGIDDEFFDENPVIAERRLGLGFGEIKAFGDFAPRMPNPHALAAAAGGGLDHHRIADAIGDLHRVLFILDHTKKARHG